MKKLRAVILGTLVAGGQQAHALINDGKFGEPGELFISVFDEDGKKSYYKDLGVDMVQFMNGQSCLDANLAQDPNFAAFAGKDNLVFNVAAVNPLLKDASNIAQWGYLATSSQGKDSFSAKWNLIDNTVQKIQAYIGALNVAPFENKPGQAAENKSGVFGPEDLAYHGNATWGPTMGQSVKGNTEGKVGAELEFYFVTNSTGDSKGEKVTKLGAWSLSSAGALSYSGTGTSTVCSGTGNTPPTAVVTNPAQTVTVNTAVTLDGSASYDPDGGPQGLSYAWKQTSGPSVTLSNASQAKASFTPTEAGSYGFQLTVSDGAATGTAQATVTVEGGSTGPSIHINAPAAWTVKQKQTISWSATGIPANKLVNIDFSKDGGSKFKRLKSIANKKGQTQWKPTKKHVTEQGVLRICAKPDKKSAFVCDQIDVMVSP
ncbi:PKD domain-containing protein [Methylococcus geothermalis]|uniref:PKD domain-containing protein n=1 Tax=Methylococcus geothermalis TaxID=2681310 RepID=A0A858Q905_9GAMM|nr:PKD domain-containing protein [Methylococcus geothermalis]QJD30275.1 PKD domain-containing protein [Methylococcus geothermalis]